MGKVKKGTFSLLILVFWMCVVIWGMGVVSAADDLDRADKAIVLLRELGPIFALLFGGSSITGAAIHYSDRRYPTIPPPDGRGEPDPPTDVV